MKLLIEIDAPQWQRPAKNFMERRNRLFQIGQALRCVATNLENSQATQGSLNHDGGLTGRFEITYD